MTTPMPPERLSRIDTMRSTRGMPEDIRKAFSELIHEVKRLTHERDEWRTMTKSEILRAHGIAESNR